MLESPLKCVINKGILSVRRISVVSNWILHFRSKFQNKLRHRYHRLSRRSKYHFNSKWSLKDKIMLITMSFTDFGFLHKLIGRIRINLMIPFILPVSQNIPVSTMNLFILLIFLHLFLLSALRAYCNGKKRRPFVHAIRLPYQFDWIKEGSSCGWKQKEGKIACGHWITLANGKEKVYSCMASGSRAYLFS